VVGLVIVSHSGGLAEGVAELARQMAGPDVKIATAGGLDQPGNPLGTDAGLIRRAIDAAYDEDGVVVLLDLGSAILSAEIALDELPPERRVRVRLTDAPLVEGAVVAAVQARLGNSLDVVVAEARRALEPKIAQLTPLGARTSGATVSAENVDDHSVVQGNSTERASAMAPIDQARGQDAIAPSGRSLHLVVTNPVGLHARPAARFVQTANQFKADVQVRNLTTSGKPVNAKSVLGLMRLAARPGHEIEVVADGIDAEAALAALEALAAAGFGENDS
jgi:phosphocarrier protein FPr